MKRLFLGILLLASLPQIAHAEIEKLANVCDSGICFHWWPKLAPVKGWHQDKDGSFNFAANTQAPDGFSFANAETVIYAKAIYKPREPEVKSLQNLIENDISQFKSDNSDIEVKNVKSLVTSDGQSLRSITFFPAKEGNWEQVSYGEEGVFYLIFTISSRSKKDFDKSIGDYKKFINTYKAISSLADK